MYSQPPINTSAWERPEFDIIGGDDHATVCNEVCRILADPHYHVCAISPAQRTYEDGYVVYVVSIVYQTRTTKEATQ